MAKDKTVWEFVGQQGGGGGGGGGQPTHRMGRLVG
jgi:hypothetical protein